LRNCGLHFQFQTPHMRSSSQHAGSNLRPGRAAWMYRLRAIANALRTNFSIKWRYPWLRVRGTVRIPCSVDFWSPHRHIVLGDRVQFGPGCVVHCDAEFGNNVLIARNVAFVGRDDHRHDVVGSTIWDSPRGDSLKVTVEDDVFIGHGCIVLSGVRIGRGAVVAAGSVVVHDVPRYAIAAGSPARQVKQRFSPEQVVIHEERLGYAERTVLETLKRFAENADRSKGR
jgi:acetyltransferase-like isoleucine patch superfamily enzyme